MTMQDWSAPSAAGVDRLEAERRNAEIANESEPAAEGVRNSGVGNEVETAASRFDGMRHWPGKCDMKRAARLR